MSLRQDLQKVPAEGMVNVFRFNAGRHGHLVKSLAKLHIEIVEYDRVAMTFLPPFNFDKMVEYWEGLATRATGGANILFLCCSSTSTASPESTDSDESFGDLLGCVILASQQTETRPSMASVEKLLVSPNSRGKGIARRLMTELEGAAKSEGCNILVSGFDPLPVS